MTRRAFTLLEVLLATSLLAVVMVATVGWTRAQARAARAAQARLAAFASVEACARAIEDDLIVATPGPDGSRWKLDGDALRVMTVDPIPGDPVGAHRVIWRFADGEVQRAVEGQPPRVVTVRVGSARFVADQANAGIALAFRVGDSQDEQTLPLRIRP